MGNQMVTRLMSSDPEKSNLWLQYA